jgi:hypothetical protein
MTLAGLLRAALAATPLLLAGCSSSGDFDLNIFREGYFAPRPTQESTVTGLCPRPAVAEDAGRLTRFAGDSRDPSNILFDAVVSDITGNCGYDKDGNIVQVDMQVQFTATRGPANKDERGPFNYFVAIARTDGTILKRDAFDGLFEFPGNKTQVQFADELEETIPLKEGERGTNYVVLVGFEMSREELDYNRQQAR